MSGQNKNSAPQSSKPVVVYFGVFALPDKNAASHRVIGNAKMLRNLGYDTHIVGFQILKNSAKESVPSEYSEITLTMLNSKTGSVPGLSSFRLNPASAIAYLGEVAKSRKISHVVCYNYPSFAQLGIQLYCKFKGITFVPDVTEWNTEKTGNLVYSMLRAIDFNSRIYLLNRLTNSLITTSPMMTRFYAGGRKRVSEIPTLFDKDKLATKTKLPKRVSDPIRIMFVGPGFDINIARPSIDVLKERIDIAVSMIIAALDCKQKIQLDIYGIELHQFASAFPDIALNMAAYRDQIVFHGRVPHEQILQGLYDSDFSLLLRDNKRANNAGFPTKFAESLIAGTPVILDEIEAIKSYHQHQHALVIKRDTPDAMANQLIDKITKYREREVNSSSSSPSFQTFHYENFENEMAHVFTDQTNGIET